MKEVLGVKLYTLKEVGELLGVLPVTVSKYIADGKMNAVLIGGRKFVTEESIKEFVLSKK